MENPQPKTIKEPNIPNFPKWDACVLCQNNGEGWESPPSHQSEVVWICGLEALQAAAIVCDAGFLNNQGSACIEYVMAPGTRFTRCVSDHNHTSWLCWHLCPLRCRGSLLWTPKWSLFNHETSHGFHGGPSQTFSWVLFQWAWPC